MSYMIKIKSMHRVRSYTVKSSESLSEELLALSLYDTYNTLDEIMYEVLVHSGAVLYTTYTGMQTVEVSIYNYETLVQLEALIQ